MFIKAVVLLGAALKGMAGAQVEERTALAQLRPRRESKGRGNNPFLAEPTVLRRLRRRGLCPPVAVTPFPGRFTAQPLKPQTIPQTPKDPSDHFAVPTPGSQGLGPSRATSGLCTPLP